MNPVAKELTLGCNESVKDSRTVQNGDLSMAGAPLIKGGIVYDAIDIEDQAHVGICTAISLVQNREKANDRAYSEDFQYLLQKRFYDMDWAEGSSILNALKVGKKYGFLPEEYWTYTTDQDRVLPYSQYIQKLQAVPMSEVIRLIGLCVDKIPGYAQVDVNDSQAIAKAINESEAGILCRYWVGKEWWTSIDGRISWSPSDIDPLRAPVAPTGGHAITMSYFDYSVATGQFIANTWGPQWCKSGSADIIWDLYKPTEAWSILDYTPPIPPFQFLHNLSYGMTSPDVKQLQIILNKNPITQVATTGAGSPGNETSYFGVLTTRAVYNFQKMYNIEQVGVVGPKTRAALNKLIS